MCAATEAQYSRYVILSIQLRGNKIRVIVDSGVIGNYISPGCVKKCHIETCDKEKLYKLALADGSPVG
jgi:hypothetical protein